MKLLWDAEVQRMLGQDDWGRIVAAVDARIRVRPSLPLSLRILTGCCKASKDK